MTGIHRISAITVLIASAVPTMAELSLHYKPSSEIRIRLYDYAGLSQTELSRAKKVAAHVLSRAGVQTVWLDCPIVELEGDNPACGLERTPLDLQLHILTEAMTEPIRVRRHSLGHALIVPGVSHFAAAYFHRAIGLEEERAIADRYDILGGIMAHEVGHLLLQDGSHARKGVMRANWLDEDLKKLRCGKIRFGPQLARRMVAGVRARTELAAPLLAEARY